MIRKSNICKLYCVLYWSDPFGLYTSNFQLGASNYVSFSKAFKELIETPLKAGFVNCACATDAACQDAFCIKLLTYLTTIVVGCTVAFVVVVVIVETGCRAHLKSILSQCAAHSSLRDGDACARNWRNGKYCNATQVKQMELKQCKVTEKKWTIAQGNKIKLMYKETIEYRQINNSVLFEENSTWIKLKLLLLQVRKLVTKWRLWKFAYSPCLRVSFQYEKAKKRLIACAN